MLNWIASNEIVGKGKDAREHIWNESSPPKKEE
jgi:hypothetical protein